jgi:hypothetical protein
MMLIEVVAVLLLAMTKASPGEKMLGLIVTLLLV